MKISEKKTCGSKKDGAVCKRDPGHPPPCCSIPEMMDLYPEAFAVVAAELAAGEYEG